MPLPSRATLVLASLHGQIAPFQPRLALESSVSKLQQHTIIRVVDHFVTLTDWPRSIVVYEPAPRWGDGGGRCRPDWKKALNAHDPAEYVSSDHLKGVRILLVEDSWHLGKALKDLLQDWGADVVGPVATTVEADRLICEHVPDVALVDLILRGASGHTA